MDDLDAAFADRCAEFGRVASERIGGDLLRTTGHTLELVGRPLDEHFHVLLTVTIFFDEKVTGSVGAHLHDGEEAGLAELADLLREHTLDEDVWGGWPTCVRHHTHPLTPTVRDGAAVWWCPTDDIVISRIGELDHIA